MTIEEVIERYQYDIGIYPIIDEEMTNKKLKWFWEINGGYCSVGSHDYFDTPEEAHKHLLEYLKYFQPFEK